VSSDSDSVTFSRLPITFSALAGRPENFAIIDARSSASREPM
jgi:hypothetical protein